MGTRYSNVLLRRLPPIGQAELAGKQKRAESNGARNPA